MNTINKFSGDNMGGIAKLWAIPVADASLIELDADNVYDLTLLKTTNVYEIYCSQESISFKQPPKNTNAGTYYQPELNAIIAKDTPTIQASLDNLKDRKWLVVYKDNNDYYKLVGEIERPMEFDCELIINQSTSSLNHHKISFYGETLIKSLFINYPF